MKYFTYLLVLVLICCFSSCSEKPQGEEQRKEITASKKIDTEERENQPVPHASPKAWALATSGIVAERNNLQHDLLSGCKPTEWNVKEWKRGLRQWWGINNREELLKMLDWLDKEGHRTDFERIGVYILSMPQEQFKEIMVREQNNEEFKNKVEIVTNNYMKLGDKSLLAWDYCRYIFLCRWGYLVGYLTEEEAWSRIMPVARMLQQTYDSWDNLGQNYLIGMEFWSYERTKESGDIYRECYQKLLNDPQSPWNLCPWNMSLD